MLVDVQVDVRLHDAFVHFLGVLADVAAHLVRVGVGVLHALHERAVELADELGSEAAPREDAAEGDRVSRCFPPTTGLGR